ncbi:MAG: Rrf2 family transcriptional regulator [Devosiaceae bacterium]|nr:Rrf2 family transcriptional regulator [Devosiaceae bacterium]
MRLTRFTDNSLRVLIYLTLNKQRDATITEIAEKVAIPRNHLMKIVHALSKKEFIKTTRGRGGGIRLALCAKKIKVGDVIRKMEERLDIIECYKPRCPLAGSCRLKNVLGEATNAFLSVLDNYSVNDLVAQRESKLMELLGIT